MSGRLTVGLALAGAVDSLRAAGVENAQAEAAWLLAHALGVPRGKLALRMGEALPPDAAAAFAARVARRRAREPLQYILGTQPFCGLDLMVDARVLIPRPETELLVERVAAALARRHAGDGGSSDAGRAVAAGAPPRIADVGTGSGCIAVALAVRLPSAEVDAIDVSADALAVARANAERFAVADRIGFLEADVLRSDFRLPTAPYDAIVSNPPYIAAGELGLLQPEVRQYEPLVALAPHPEGPAGAPGDDPLIFYRRLGELAAAGLALGGILAVELAAGRAGVATDAVRRAAAGALGDAQLFADASGIARVAMLRRR